ncbi:hypothetical protein MLD52_11735 [Puniceicoccaceae bacterium K14]|nr:hypothetical protein [Puniceicoccaceae bacterium K14]
MRILAAFSQNPTVGENTTFVIFGFAFVLFVLLALAALTACVGVLFKRIEKKADKGYTDPVSIPLLPKIAPKPKGQEENCHIPFLVTAAVATVLDGQPHRIVSVKPSRDGWAQEGRRQIFSSHRVR